MSIYEAYYERVKLILKNLKSTSICISYKNMAHDTKLTLFLQSKHYEP